MKEIQCEIGLKVLFGDDDPPIWGPWVTENKNKNDDNKKQSADAKNNKPRLPGNQGEDNKEGEEECNDLVPESIIAEAITHVLGTHKACILPSGHSLVAKNTKIVHKLRLDDSHIAWGAASPAGSHSPKQRLVDELSKQLHRFAFRGRLGGKLHFFFTSDLSDAEKEVGCALKKPTHPDAAAVLLLSDTITSTQLIMTLVILTFANVAGVIIDDGEWKNERSNTWNFMHKKKYAKMLAGFEFIIKDHTTNNEVVLVLTDNNKSLVTAYPFTEKPMESMLAVTDTESNVDGWFVGSSSNEIYSVYQGQKSEE